MDVVTYVGRSLLLSWRRLVRLGSAVALLGGGVALFGAPVANAATPSCGPSCVNLFSAQFGTTSQPTFVLDSYQQGQATGTPLVLFATSNTIPGEDFTASTASVADYYQAGLVSAAVALNYGCDPGVDFTECTGDADDMAFELQYSPFGAPPGECMGVAATAVAGEKVSLQPCGVSSKTVWIIDSSSSIDGSFVPLINASDTNFTSPFVLTYPAGASPTQIPYPQLEVTNLSSGPTPDNQLWSETLGQLPGGPAPTTTTIESSANPSVPGQTVTYTATVNPTDDGGTVIFLDGTTPIAACTAQVLNSEGDATCQVTYPNTGSYDITATYTGDSAYAGSPSAVLTQLVVPDKADLKIALGVPRTAGDGVEVNESVTVTNNGPATAIKVGTELTNLGSLTVTNADGAKVNGPVLTWTTAALAPGADVTFTVTVEVGVHARGIALVGAGTLAATPDPDLLNNVGAATILLD